MRHVLTALIVLFLPYQASAQSNESCQTVVDQSVQEFRICENEIIHKDTKALTLSADFFTGSGVGGVEYRTHPVYAYRGWVWVASGEQIRQSRRLSPIISRRIQRQGQASTGSSHNDRSRND